MKNASSSYRESRERQKYRGAGAPGFSESRLSGAKFIPFPETGNARIGPSTAKYTCKYKVAECHEFENSPTPRERERERKETRARL